MKEQELSLEEILNEYAPKEEGSSLLDEPYANPDTVIETINTKRGDSRESTEGMYVQRNMPSMKLNRDRVSFMQSSAIHSMPMRVNVPSSEKDTAQQRRMTTPSEDVSKIRRMSDSTRAKEIARQKRRKKKKGKSTQEEERTYPKERPEGEYLYTQVHGAKKMRERRQQGRTLDVTAVGTETIHIGDPDIIAMSQRIAPEPVQPVEVGSVTPRAAMTSIDLSAKNRTVSPEGLDVKIEVSKEEAEEETRRRQQISDSMELEDVADIRADIAELHNAITYRAMVLLLVLLISAYLALGADFSITWVENLSPTFAMLLQALLGVAAAGICAPVLKNGLQRLVRLHADTDSLSALALLSSILATIVCLVKGDAELTSYMPCAIAVSLLHTLGKLLIIGREKRNLSYLAKRFDCHGVSIVEDSETADTMVRGVLGNYPVLASMRKTENITDFRKYTYSADLSDRFCRKIAPLFMVIAILLSVALCLLKAKGLAYGVNLFSIFSAAGGCAAITFCSNLPLHRATKQMARSGALMLGYQSVDDFYDTNAMMVDVDTLFPPKSVTLEGMKMLSHAKTDEILGMATSLAEYGGSVLREVLRKLTQEYKSHRVENFLYEDGLGISGWVKNQRVLLGNRELMISHSIEGLPTKIKENELIEHGAEMIYLSVSGNLSAYFLVRLGADSVTKYWVKESARRGVALVFRSVDSMITLPKLCKLFEVSSDAIKIIPAKLHEEYARETKSADSMSSSVICNGSFPAFAQLMLGASTVRRCAFSGVFWQAIFLVVGCGVVALNELFFLGLTPLWMLVFHVIASLLTLLSVHFRRL